MMVWRLISLIVCTALIVGMGWYNFRLFQSDVELKPIWPAALPLPLGSSQPETSTNSDKVQNTASEGVQMLIRPLFSKTRRPFDDLPEDASELGVDDTDQLQDIASEAPVVRFVIDTIETATARQPTDIHIEPLQDKVMVRCRVDGLLHPIAQAPKSLHAGIATRIKVLSKLNIAEQRGPTAYHQV